MYHLLSVPERGCCIWSGIDDDEPEPFEAFLFDPTLEEEPAATTPATESMDTA